MDYKRLRGAIRGYRGLQRITGRLQEVRGCYKGLQGVTEGLEKVTGGYKGFEGFMGD